MLPAVLMLLAIPLGRILDICGARLMLGDPETAETTRRVAERRFWPPDLLQIIRKRNLPRDGNTLLAEATAAVALGIVAIALIDPLRVIHAVFFTAVFLFLASLDLRERVIPNLVVLPASVAAVALAGMGLGPSWRSSIVAGAFGLLIFLAIYGAGVLVARRMKLPAAGIGAGDVKLAALIGLIVGWPAVVSALFLGILLGGFVSAGLIVARRALLKSYIPYAPFLLAGGYLTLVFGRG